MPERPRRQWGREDQNTMLEALEHEGNLTRQEEEFVQAVRSWFNAGLELSERQIETLARMYHAERT